MNSRYSNLLLVAAGVILVCSAGCYSSSDIGRVSGVVTFEGEPVDGAKVAFYPPNGRASTGVSDETGRYELKYMKEMGARIGEHKVTISTKRQESIDYRGAVAGKSGDDSNEVITPGRDEILPEKYTDRRTTELTATVTSGSNEINFELFR